MVAHASDSLNLDSNHLCYFVGALSAGMAGRSGPFPRGRKTQEGAVSVRLFIGNLPYAASEAELREHLSSVGEPAQIVLPVDRETGRPRGFAFVDYADRAIAEAAISRFDQQPFKGRPLAVSEARPREERGPGGPRPGGYGGPRPGGPGGPAGGGGFTPRPSGWAPRPDSGGAPGGPRNRNFGPDAPPKNKRKPPRKDSERGPRGPIKERPVSRLYENDEDWRNDKDDDLEIDDIATSVKPDDPDKE
jgi:RNA recognition motif-containing protein